VTYEGVIGRYDTQILTLGVLQGVLADHVEGEVNLVNAKGIAEERGIKAKEVKKPAAVDFLNLITVTSRCGEELRVAGTTLGPRHRPRIVSVYGRDMDIEPVAHMVFVRAKAQVPGTFGKLGAKMGEFGINISQVSVGTSLPGQPEVMGLAIDAPITDAQLAQIVEAAGLLDARRVEL
jgi:D-3-phosphoglycerate dehydrogenase / 2-oxoglutarate reductase